MSTVRTSTRQDEAIVRTFDQLAGRPTIAVIDLDVMAANIACIRELIGPRVRLMSVVKANAYGHGAVTIGRQALRFGADALAVATVDEGIELREVGIAAPVLVMGPIGSQERVKALRHDLQLVVSSAEFARGLAADVRWTGHGPAMVHLKVDTGMRRFGCAPAEALSIAQEIEAAPELRFVGLMTHFACADGPDPAFTLAQAARFDAVVAELRAEGIPIPTRHLANSAGTVRFPALHRDMVRCGIAMHGLPPDPDMVMPAGLRPTMSIYSRVARVIPLAAGDTVSYGATYRSPGGECGALVPIGYGDGYPRGLSNQGWMALGGGRARVLGRVCMDQTIVRVPDGVEPYPGQIVKIAGDGSAGEPTLNEIAVATGTIAHEVITGIAPRLPKVYLEGGEIVAVDDLAGVRQIEGAGQHGGAHKG